MNKYFLSYLVGAMSLLSLPAFSQTVSDSTLLGLPGDNLDLYAVLDLFQKSKTIEDFEKSLNLEKTAINNLDLDLDQKVDFIKVVTKSEGDDFTFILQVAVSKTETQDVAVILVTKDENKKINMQIVGDKDLYGENYIVELKESKTPAVTANPAYTGNDTVIVSAPAKTTVVVVESTPVVQYVYSPVYVPYVSPYYYGFYPPFFVPFSVMAVGIYIGHHSYYHGGYYGGYHGNTVVIHNHNTYNNYNNNRNTSNTVNRNNKEGNYNKGNNASTRPSTGAGASTRPSTGGASTRPTTGAGASTREAGGASTRQSGGTSPSTRQGVGPERQSNGTSPRQSSNYSSQPTRQSSNYSQQNRSSNGASRYSGGSSNRSSGGYSGGGGRGGGGRSGGRR